MVVRGAAKVSSIAHFSRRLIALASGAAAAMAVSTLGAQEIGPRLSADARLRYEFAEDAEAGMQGDAFAARLRTTAETPLPFGWSALGELEFIGVAADEDAAPVQPLARTADAVDLNRLQARWAPRAGHQLTLGRQRIELDDKRFLGASDFRLNDRTFDAVSGSALVMDRVSVEAGAFWRVKTPAGPRSDVGVLKGASWFLNASAATGLGQLTAFHYAFDLDDGRGLAESHARSSATTGVRLDHRAPLADVLIDIEAGYALQQAHADNPARYEADYSVIGLTATGAFFEAGVRREELGADDGGAFQAPLGNLHAFNGAADIFTTTPEAGLLDTAARLVLRRPGVTRLRGPSLAVAYHEFDASRGDARYGREWDVRLAANILGQPIALEYADYRADRFARDTRRLWITAQRRF